MWNLPPECTYKVIEYLDSPSLLSLRLVSRQFAEIGSTIIWQCVTFDSPCASFSKPSLDDKEDNENSSEQWITEIFHHPYNKLSVCITSENADEALFRLEANPVRLSYIKNVRLLRAFAWNLAFNSERTELEAIVELICNDRKSRREQLTYLYVDMPRSNKEDLEVWEQNFAIKLIAESRQYFVNTTGLSGSSNYVDPLKFPTLHCPAVAGMVNGSSCAGIIVREKQPIDLSNGSISDLEFVATRVTRVTTDEISERASDMFSTDLPLLCSKAQNLRYFQGCAPPDTWTCLPKSVEKLHLINTASEFETGLCLDLPKLSFLRLDNRGAPDNSLILPFRNCSNLEVVEYHGCLERARDMDSFLGGCTTLRSLSLRMDRYNPDPYVSWAALERSNITNLVFTLSHLELNGSGIVPVSLSHVTVLININDKELIDNVARFMQANLQPHARIKYSSQCDVYTQFDGGKIQVIISKNHTNLGFVPAADSCVAADIASQPPGMRFKQAKPLSTTVET